MNRPAIDHDFRSTRPIAFTALAASLLIGIQLALIVWQGEAACLNEGCRIVEGLTRVSPFVFNLFGLLFFLSIALLAILAQKRPAVRRLLSLLLLAAMAGEGVLLAYQYHVARAWCSYCLVIFALVALCNLLAGLRQLFSATVLVAAVNVIFALLRFEPVPHAGQASGLAAGTAAVLPGTASGREVFLIYSRDCPHCLALLQKLPEFAACTIRLNPVGEPPEIGIPGLEPLPDFQPAKNLLLLRSLQIDAVPVLVVPEESGYRIIRREPDIDAYLQANCRDAVESGPPGPETNEPETILPPDIQSLLPPTRDQECRVDVECPDPLPPDFIKAAPVR